MKRQEVGEGGREGGKGESGEESKPLLCGMAAHTFKSLQNDVLKSCRFNPLIVGAHLGLYSLEKHAFTSSNSTSQETSSNPQRPATPLSWGMGSLGTLEYPAFAGGRKQLQTEPSSLENS